MDMKDDFRGDEPNESGGHLTIQLENQRIEATSFSAERIQRLKQDLDSQVREAQLAVVRKWYLTKKVNFFLQGCDDIEEFLASS